MKRFFLVSSFFLLFTIGLTAFVTINTGSGVPLEGIEFLACEIPAGEELNAAQPAEPYAKEGIGSTGQVCAGVNIHFITGHEKDLDMIADAGFKYVRMDFTWQRIEKTKGVYDWSGYDELTANLEKRGLNALYILDYSNSLYEDTVASVNPITGKERKGIASPQHPESIAAFAKWAAVAAERYKDYNIIWEIWNEPNITFWKPEPDVRQYTALALATGRAIKKEVPEARIIGPATSELPLRFLETFLGSGMSEYLDAVSVHPYRNYSKSPETVTGEYRQLRELIDQFVPEGERKMPVISSEWGYATHTKGISLEKQAEYIVRMQLVNLINKIPFSIWYDWKDDGRDPEEREHNFGTVTFDLDPKPAYNVIQTMNKQLDGYILTYRMDLENDIDYVLVFKNGNGHYKLSAWTMGREHTVLLDEKIRKVTGATAVNGYGGDIELRSDRGRLMLDLSTMPVYIDLPSGVRVK